MSRNNVACDACFAIILSHSSNSLTVLAASAGLHLIYAYKGSLIISGIFFLVFFIDLRSQTAREDQTSLVYFAFRALSEGIRDDGEQRATRKKWTMRRQLHFATANDVKPTASCKPLFIPLVHRDTRVRDTRLFCLVRKGTLGETTRKK